MQFKFALTFDFISSNPTKIERINLRFCFFLMFMLIEDFFIFFFIILIWIFFSLYFYSSMCASLQWMPNWSLQSSKQQPANSYSIKWLKQLVCVKFGSLDFNIQIQKAILHGSNCIKRYVYSILPFIIITIMLTFNILCYVDLDNNFCLFFCIQYQY